MRLIDAGRLKEVFDAVDPSGTFAQCSTILDKIDEQPTVPQWISVKDRLPKIGVPVLVFANADNWGETVYYVEIDGLMEDELWDKNGSKVTHWMPIPAPPKEEE